MALQTKHSIDPNFKQGGGLGVIEQLDLTTAYPQTVAILDGSGNQITSFGGGTQYTEDGAAVANPIGTSVNLIRQDTPATLVTTDGDNVALRGTNYGAAYMQVVTSSGSFVDTFGGGTQYTEDAAAAANPVGNALIVIREDARAGSLTTTDGDNVALRGNNLGELYVKHTDSIAVTQSGTWDEVGINDSGNNISIDWAGTVPPIGAGTEAAALRVTVATDSTGVLSVDDNASSLTVDNAGLTELAAAINASSQMDVNIAASGATVPVSGTFWQATQPISGTVTANLAAGTNNIGDVDILTIAAGDNNIGNVDLASSIPAGTNNIGDVDVLSSALPTGASTLAEQQTQTASLSVIDDWDNAASDGASVSGDVAHDSADAGEPVKIGMKAVALKTNPTEVAANDRTNWYADVSGVPFVLGGHPNILTQSLQVTDGDGAQTDTAIITAGANVAVVVTKVSVTADNANTGDVSCRIGFGTANTPAADAAQVLLFHPGIAPGSGVIEGSGSGIIGIGASNEDVRVTCEDPAGGSINIIVTYFTTDI